MNHKITPPHTQTFISRLVRLSNVFVKKVPFFSKFVLFVRHQLKVLLCKDIFCRHAKLYNSGYGKINKYIEGSDNAIIIGAGTYMHNTLFRIRGHNNKIIIGEHCSIGAKCSFWMEGNNILIEIGDNTTFTMQCHCNAQEDNSYIKIGKDCMISNNIIIRTSDSHPIYDIESGVRLNEAKPVEINNHVWVAPNTKIMKGAIIGEGCIIGSNTMVSKQIPHNSLAVGTPAKVVKQNVRWSREDVIFCKN